MGYNCFMLRKTKYTTLYKQYMCDHTIILESTFTNPLSHLYISSECEGAIVPVKVDVICLSLLQHFHLSDSPMVEHIPARPYPFVMGHGKS